MFDKLISVENRYEELMSRLGTVELQSDAAEYRKAAKTLSELEPLVKTFREFKTVEQDMAGARELAEGADPDMRDLAHEELKALETRHAALLHELKVLLIPKDPNDEKNVILEIRAGTGGEEAALFAAELFRMYTRYAEREGWRAEVVSESPGEVGGYKEIIAHLAGGVSLDEAIDTIIVRTRQFAVRQERWFRRDPRIRWVHIEHDPVAEVLPVLAAL